MKKHRSRRFLVTILGAIGCAAATFSAVPAYSATIEIQVATYKLGVSGAPWQIADANGYFKELGLDVDVRSSVGGTADVRAMIASDLPFVETGLQAVLAAEAQGADLKIISDDVRSYANLEWVALASSPINSLADLKGHKISYSTPQSSTQMAVNMMLAKRGYAPNDVQTVSAGSIGAQWTLLDNHAVDVITGGVQDFFGAPEGKYKVISSITGEIPPLNSTVGVTTAKAAREHPDVLRKLLLAHRKAVEFMIAHPDESAAIIAKGGKWDPKVIAKVLSIVATNNDCFGLGDFGGTDVGTGAQALTDVGVFPTLPDWKKLVDLEFLPPDLQAIGIH